MSKSTVQTRTCATYDCLHSAVIRCPPHCLQACKGDVNGFVMLVPCTIWRLWLSRELRGKLDCNWATPAD
jgi:hypothetical protein